MNHTGMLGQVVLSEHQLRSRVTDLGAEISRDYEGRQPVLVGVLKGAAMFTVDLARAISLSISMEWVSISTYGADSVSSGVIRLRKDLDSEVTDRDVLIVEDVIDTGLTASWLVSHLTARKAKSVEVCALMRLHKGIDTSKRVNPRYIGFEIDSAAWVAGYGIDYADRYRNLADVREYMLPTANV